MKEKEETDDMLQPSSPLPTTGTRQRLEFPLRKFQSTNTLQSNKRNMITNTLIPFYKNKSQTILNILYLTTI